MNYPDSDFNVALVRGNLKEAMTSANAKNPHSLWSVPPSELHIIEGFNGRIHNAEYEKHVEAITQSIIENGFYQDKPLSGYVAKDDADNDIIYITEGHTRFDAVNRAIERGANIEFVPIVIKPNGTSFEDLTVALITSNEGKPFTPLEKSIIIKRLIGYGLDESTIAKRLMMTKKYVGDLLALAAAPKAVRDMVATDKISATLAIQELHKNGTKAQEVLSAAIKSAKEKGKEKATEKHVEKTSSKAAKKRKAIKEISDELVFADAADAGFPDDFDRNLLLSFAANLLDRYGVVVMQTIVDEVAETTEYDDDGL